MAHDIAPASGDERLPVAVASRELVRGPDVASSVHVAVASSARVVDVLTDRRVRS